MTIKPIQISLFICVILGVLFGLMFLSEEGDVKNAQIQDDGFTIEGVTLKYPTYDTFLGISRDTVLTRQDVIKVTQIVQPLDIEETDIKSDIVLEPSTPQLPDYSKIDTTKIERIKFPDAVNPDFRNELREKLTSRSCRIIHYGDSQIEGDRITGYLRNRLQKMYTGSGPGFLPVLPVYNQISAVIKPSENWKRYAYFDPTKKKYRNRKYGAYLSASRFTKYQRKLPDSTMYDTLPLIKASVVLGRSKNTYMKFRRFNNIGLHYGNSHFPIKITVYNKGKIIQQGDLKADGKYHHYKIKTPITPRSLKIELEGKVSADFYGLTLDGGKGVQIDNVAMRGASGTKFTSSSSSTYRRMIKELDPKIFIMQYGGNMMPHLKDSTDVVNYTQNMKSQFKWIRQRAKNSNIIFIGPTDMCEPVNGKMETYPLLEYFNTQLMQMCLDNNVAYWSMFDAMGGAGAMTLWVDEKLTANDYMHFTWKGTKIISELFFIALYLDINEPTS